MPVTGFTILPGSTSGSSGNASHGLGGVTHAGNQEAEAPIAFTSLPDANGVLRAPGRLFVSPTDLSAGAPYGGTAVGLTRGVMLVPTGTGLNVFSEGFGGFTDVLEADDSFVFSAFLRGFNDDAIRLLLPEYQTLGSATGHRVVNVPRLSYAGSSTLSRAVTLLYVPDDPVRVPSILIFTAIPDLQRDAEIMLQREEELGFPLAFQCMRGSLGVYQMGRLADLSLS